MIYRMPRGVVEYLHGEGINVRIKHESGYELVTVRGRLDYGRHMHFAEEIRKYTSDKKPLVFDFSRVDSFDSSAAADLVAILQNRQRRDIAICGASGKTRNCIEFNLGSSGPWRFFDNVREALAWHNEHQ